MDGKELLVLRILEACNANNDTFLTQRNIYEFMDRNDERIDFTNMNTKLFNLLVDTKLLETKFNGSELVYKITKEGINNIATLSNDLANNKIQES
jgi:predicted transcriptional regulator